MTTYEKLLCAAAEYEVEQIKKSGQTFVLDKCGFNPNRDYACFYGQVFGNCYNEKALKFKHGNNIRIGFDEQGIITGCQNTALESLLVRLWNASKKEQVYKIVEQFATWKQDTPILAKENLFTL